GSARPMSSPNTAAPAAPPPTTTTSAIRSTANARAADPALHAGPSAPLVALEAAVAAKLAAIHMQRKCGLPIGEVPAPVRVSGPFEHPRVPASQYPRRAGVRHRYLAVQRERLHLDHTIQDYLDSPEAVMVMDRGGMAGRPGDQRGPPASFAPAGRHPPIAVAG